VAFSSLVWIHFTGYSSGEDSRDVDYGATSIFRFWSPDLMTWHQADPELTNCPRSPYISESYKKSNFIAFKPKLLLKGMRHVVNSQRTSFQLKFMLYGYVAEGE
jgi:hypothetical protein